MYILHDFDEIQWVDTGLQPNRQAQRANIIVYYCHVTIAIADSNVILWISIWKCAVFECVYYAVCIEYKFIAHFCCC